VSQNGHIELRIDLGEDGFPDQWVQMSDIGRKSPEQFEGFQAAAIEQGNDAVSAQRFLGSCIESWYVLNPQTGEPLPKPSSSEWEIKQIPMRVNKRIQENIAAQMDDVLPKAPSRNL
jgi:hypothetical protein